ncbi:hypothetical protein KKB55_19760 [Myxococcota bacterium]|nr:hypothetical protein [Myxococcota bacterium]MBU1899985.1 hypothetical protein [Myxococcota bacterium]
MTSSMRAWGAIYLMALTAYGCEDQTSATPPPATWTLQDGGASATDAAPLGDGGALDAARALDGAHLDGAQINDAQINDAAPRPDISAPQSECERVCAQIQSCVPQGFDAQACLEGCPQQTQATRDCVLAATCSGLNACFSDPPPPDDCQAACQRIAECDPQGDTADCLGTCAAQAPAWATCVISARCEDLSDCDEDTPPPPTACQRGCQRLSECVEGADVAGCLEACDPETLGCVEAGADCAAISACLDGPPPAEGCQAACAHIAECSEGDLDIAACIQACQADDPGLSGCVLAAACAEIPACFGEDPPPQGDCAAICARIEGCGFPEFDAPSCLSGCEADTAARRACLQDAACAEMEACFSDEPSCAAVCDHLLSCAPPSYPFNLEQCGLDCARDNNPQVRQCVVGSDCASVNLCFQ